MRGSRSRSLDCLHYPLLALFAASLWLPTGLAQPVTTSDLENAAKDNSSWLMYGRDYYGQRYVELDQITPANVRRLHPAWVFATGGENRGLQATPLIHEGVLYVSADESRLSQHPTGPPLRHTDLGANLLHRPTLLHRA